MERKFGGGVVRLVRGDITEMEVDAFVYDITSDVKLGSGFGGAIQQRGGSRSRRSSTPSGAVRSARRWSPAPDC